MKERVFVVAVALSSAAGASEVTLRYVASPNAGCPDEAAFRTLVAARLGTDPFTDGADTEVSVELRPPTAVVTLSSPPGTVRGRKTLEGSAGCDALASSAAVTVALSVDPLLRRNAPPTPSAPPPPPVLEEESPPAPAPPPRAPEREPDAPWRWSLAAGGGASAGASVAPQPVLFAEGRARGRVFSLALEARLGWPVSAALASGRLTTIAALGALLPCLHAGWFGACARVSAGALVVSGEALPDAQSHAVFQLGLGLRAQLELPLGRRFALRAFVEGEGNLFRAAAEVGSARVWTAAPVSGGGGLALLVHFDGPLTETAAPHNSQVRP
ncbi:MAG: hypothetical protein IPJ65_22855 [Archangiaceae bacterium]|nr:hypothetical protein [Archangiaceae bacterium]